MERNFKSSRRDAPAYRAGFARFSSSRFRERSTRSMGMIDARSLSMIPERKIVRWEKSAE